MAGEAALEGIQDKMMCPHGMSAPAYNLVRLLESIVLCEPLRFRITCSAQVLIQELTLQAAMGTFPCDRYNAPAQLFPNHVLAAVANLLKGGVLPSQPSRVIYSV